MLEERIDDRALLRLIGKWLKAGILDTDGTVHRPETGTPQGGNVSAVLANVYLHYVLDLWFTRVVQPSCKGGSFLIRYADDWVCGFEDQTDAENFYAKLGERLKKFGLELAAEKTRVLRFSREQAPTGDESFEFLGFEFRWGKDRSGKPHVQRRTSPKKQRKSIERFTDWCKKTRNLRNKARFAQLHAKLRGYYNYYGLPGNMESLRAFYYQAMQILRKWLNRRSQMPSYDWPGFIELLKFFPVPPPRIVNRTRARTPGMLIA